MKLKTALLIMGLAISSAGAHAQADKEERTEKQAETKAHAKYKADCNLFHRQMLSLKEFSEERRKIPALQKANKTAIKITAVVDTSDEESKSNMLTGYIVQNIGDNTTNIYEVIYDRTEKKITGIKHTAEAADAEKADKEDEAGDSKPEPKKTVHKKGKDDDDDGDDDDKPVKDKDEDKE